MRFYPTPRLTAADVADVLATVEPGLRGAAGSAGLGDGDEGHQTLFAVSPAVNGVTWPSYKQNLVLRAG